jgi:glycosyltransferase involved in cell wall biosynthesis
MKVSIVTAVRNGAAAIGVTLDSVAAQTHADIEHVVVDGASTDGTVEVVRTRGRHVAKLLSEPDRGVYDAFNKGLALATGEIVVYLNAGDSYLDAEVVATVARVFAAEDVDAVFGDVLIVDAQDPGRVVRHYRSSRFSPARLASGFMPAHPTLFLRRGLYGRLGGYDASYRIAGDFELCVRAFVQERARYRYLPRPLVRMPQGGLSTRDWRSNWIITREMRRACLDNGVATSLPRLLLRFPVKLLEVLHARR